jgi:hypothetical protein
MHGRYRSPPEGTVRQACDIVPPVPLVPFILTEVSRHPSDRYLSNVPAAAEPCVEALAQGLVPIMHAHGAPTIGALGRVLNFTQEVPPPILHRPPLHPDAAPLSVAGVFGALQRSVDMWRPRPLSWMSVTESLLALAGGVAALLRLPPPFKAPISRICSRTSV